MCGPRGPRTGWRCPPVAEPLSPPADGAAASAPRLTTSRARPASNPDTPPPSQGRRCAVRDEPATDPPQPSSGPGPDGGRPGSEGHRGRLSLARYDRLSGRNLRRGAGRGGALRGPRRAGRGGPRTATGAPLRRLSTPPPLRRSPPSASISEASSQPAGPTRRARLEDPPGVARAPDRAHLTPTTGAAEWWARTPRAWPPPPCTAPTDAVVITRDARGVPRPARGRRRARVERWWSPTRARRSPPPSARRCSRSCPRSILFAPSREEVRRLLPGGRTRAAQRALDARGRWISCRNEAPRGCGGRPPGSRCGGRRAARGRWPTPPEPATPRSAPSPPGSPAGSRRPALLLREASAVAARTVAGIGPLGLGLELPLARGRLIGSAAMHVEVDCARQVLRAVPSAQGLLARQSTAARWSPCSDPPAAARPRCSAASPASHLPETGAGGDRRPRHDPGAPAPARGGDDLPELRALPPSRRPAQTSRTASRCARSGGRSGSAGWPPRSTLVSLGKLADRYPSQLSGGQQQRVAIRAGTGAGAPPYCSSTSHSTPSTRSSATRCRASCASS